MNRPAQYIWALGVAIALGAAGLRVCGADGLFPDVSVVDYLKSVSQASDFSARKGLFQARFPGENYKGTAEQNMRLLARLVADNKEAATAARECEQAARKATENTGPATQAIRADFACPGWVPAKGFGVHGSYGFSVHASRRNGKIVDRDFMVVMFSAASQLGAASMSGKVRVLIEGQNKPIQEFPLQEAWFQTVGTPGSVARFAKQGTDITVPAGKKVRAEITLYPTVKTTAGVVALWSCTRTITLGD